MEKLIKGSRASPHAACDSVLPDRKGKEKKNEENKNAE